MPGLPGPAAAQLLASLGAVAIVFGNVVALRQERLKLLIAYSTLAQIGYLFLMFPLAFDPGSAQLERAGALTGGLLQTISHATAKAAMFLAAGMMYAALGHDRIAGLAGSGRALPVSVVTFALAGAALIGLPPSGAYLAKKLLLGAATETGQWWWGLVMQVGGLLTSGYVVLVLAHALSPADDPVRVRAPVPRRQEAAALVLALCSLSLGLAGVGPALRDSASNPLAPSDLWTALWTVLGGGVVAILLGQRLPRVPGSGGVVALVSPARPAAVALGRMLERADGVLRHWPVAGLSLLLLAIAFGAAMVLGRAE
jgi:NADH:ubiquinone oxidoreductase subunit 5 (subunit L)/multisubunit Na+/H+ antiporter MnhA subunit